MISVEVTRKDATKAVIRDLQNAEIAFVTMAGGVIQAEMRARAAIDTGNMKNSVQTEAYVEDGKPTCETGPTADYAVYQEYGTGVYATNGNGRQTPWAYRDATGKFHRTIGARAQPFAEPGFQAARLRFNSLAKKALAL
jgi:HK97 gp10 family phage protein